MFLRLCSLRPGAGRCGPPACGQVSRPSVGRAWKAAPAVAMGGRVGGGGGRLAARGASGASGWLRCSGDSTVCFLMCMCGEAVFAP